MSLQERTLVVRNFDPDKTSARLLRELFIQAGPVRNVVVKPDHAFVEFEDIESVGYSKALLDGINFHNRRLFMEPKIRTERNMKYTQILQDYIKYDKNQRAMQQQQQMFLQQQMTQQQLIAQQQLQQRQMMMSFYQQPQQQPQPQQSQQPQHYQFPR